MSELFSKIVSEARASGDHSFCVPLAYSVVTGIPFNDINNMMIKSGIRRKGSGVSSAHWKPFSTTVGVQLEDITDVVRHSARTVRTAARLLKRGKFLIQVRGHLLAVVDGVVHDWTKERQHRIIRVFRVLDVASATPAAPATPAPVAPAAPAPFQLVAPKKVIQDVMASARELRSLLHTQYGFAQFELAFSGKFVKYNTRLGTTYLSRNKNQVRLFVRNEDTIRAIQPLLVQFGLGEGVITAKYTFWMLTFSQLKLLRDVL
jgi:hypothetical protein